MKMVGSGGDTQYIYRFKMVGDVTGMMPSWGEVTPVTLVDFLNKAPLLDHHVTLLCRSDL